MRSFRNSLVPCAIMTSRSISPKRKPPSRARPSAGCRVNMTIGPLARLCILSSAMIVEFRFIFLSYKSATLEELSEADVLIVSISIHTCFYLIVYAKTFSCFFFVFFFIHSTSRTSAMRLGESKRLPYWRNCRTWSAYSAVAQMIY